VAMNRETKRMLQRQGQLTEDGTPKASRRPAPSPNAPKEPRTKPREFFREIKAELRKVAWPTRAETLSLSLVVFVFLVLLTALIAVFDFGFSKAVLWIVDQ
jgi:preprotein translocase subunit SecE